MRTALRCLAGLLLLPMTAFASPVGQGLVFNADPAAWSTWQARLAVVTPAPLAPSAWGPSNNTGAIRLSGDRYFHLWQWGDGGGLRATGALLLGQRSLAMSAPVPLGPAPWSWSPSQSLAGSDAEPGLTATPYVGLGYSAWWHRWGLGVSADLGLLAQRAGAASQTGWLMGSDGAEASGLRSLQIAPVLQLHLSYAF